jgi:putative ABC transport system permease protein
VTLALKRLTSHLGPTLAVAAGLTVAVALVVCIPLYANAMGYRLLVEQLAANATRPPFAFLFRYVGAWHGALAWDDIAPADAYLTDRAAQELALPMAGIVRHVRTDKWQLHPGASGGYDAGQAPLAWLALGFLDDVADHIRIVEGGPLPTAAASASAAVPVLVARPLADELGLQAGETYLLAAPAQPQTPIEVTLVGVWEPAHLDPAYWLYLPQNFTDVLLTSEAAFHAQVTPRVRGAVGLAAWYLVADDRAVNAGSARALEPRIAAVRARLDGLLPNLALDHSPEPALQAYRQQTARLTLLLFAFGTPILSLVLAFVGLVAGMAVQRQQEEIVVLRSRGGTRRDVVGLYAAQWGLLGLVALLAGGPLGWAAATAMARTRSFLQFSPEAAARVLLDARSWAAGLGAVALALLAAVLPARRAARHTVVTHGQRARDRRPWWQRYGLDLLLLLPALYGYVLLRGPAQLLAQLRRALPELVARRLPAHLPLTRLTQGDLYGNPLLFLVPALFITAWALILLRIFPLVMAVLARASRRLRSPVPLLVCHELSEQVQRVAGPLLLLTATTALATFSASLALTLDTHLIARTSYQVGADLRLVEQGERVQQPGSSSASFSPQGSDDADWVFLPIAEHRELPGVRGATRVANYGATASLGGRTEVGRFLGIDRLDLPGVAYFQDDFAPQSLGALLNALAAERRGVLVERRFLARHGLGPGDPLRLTIDVLGERVELTMVVVGALDYFPTLYPENGPFFVGNLATLFTHLGGLYPYDVWLATEPGSTDEIVRALNARGVPVISTWDTRARILAEQQRPQRQGLFGLLTLGFLAAGLLTVAGLALHALLAFRERTVELGVLRAIGFSVGQMRRYLAGTQLTLLVLGLAAGTALGIATGRLFIPFLQVDAGLHPNTPPFVPRTAWAEIALVYALFAAAATVTIGATLALLRRMRLYEAIKMGEAA